MKAKDLFSKEKREVPANAPRLNDRNNGGIAGRHCWAELKFCSLVFAKASGR